MGLCHLCINTAFLPCFQAVCLPFLQSPTALSRVFSTALDGRGAATPLYHTPAWPQGGSAQPSTMKRGVGSRCFIDVSLSPATFLHCKSVVSDVDIATPAILWLASVVHLFHPLLSILCLWIKAHLFHVSCRQQMVGVYFLIQY